MLWYDDCGHTCVKLNNSFIVWVILLSTVLEAYIDFFLTMVPSVVFRLGNKLKVELNVYLHLQLAHTLHNFFYTWTP